MHMEVIAFGNSAVRHLLEAKPDNAGSYTLLCNIYASAGKWKEAAEIRSEMNNRCLFKQPGCSWFQVANKVHVFVSSDKSHCDSALLNCLLQDIHHIIKFSGSAVAIKFQKSSITSVFNKITRNF